MNNYSDKLDFFRPTSEELNSVKEILTRAGIPEAHIPKEWLYTILAAIIKSQTTTKLGLKLVLRRLNTYIESGKEEFDYELLNEHTGNSTPVSSDELVFFNGTAINGVPVDPSCILAIEKDRVKCDGCGVRSHCVKEIFHPASETLENLCVYCTSHDEINVYALNPRSCKDCTVSTCTNHHLYRKSNK